MKKKQGCEASFGTMHVASSAQVREAKEIWPNLFEKEKKKKEQPGWKKRLSAVGK